ncbi:hypothetical protein niasHT_029075 [Heterodera trifolii]|uniref:Uncharacterized protein n=1 Tax=Heterodera trifolii TaxID=157864 RepID=A0ABD2KRT5_9BILA
MFSKANRPNKCLAAAFAYLCHLINNNDSPISRKKCRIFAQLNELQGAYPAFAGAPRRTQIFLPFDFFNIENTYKQELQPGQNRYLVSLRTRVQNGRESVRQYFAREGTTDTFEQYFECRLNSVQLPHDPTFDWDVLEITYTVDTIISNWNKLMSFIFDDVISRIENGQVPDRPGSPPSLL